MFTRFWPAVAVAAALVGSPVAALAQDGNAVLGTVNGKPITEADMALTQDYLGQALEQYPPQQRNDVAMRFLIDMLLLADAGEEKGLESDPVYDQRMAFMRTQTLRDLYLQRVIEEQISEDAVRARYEEEAKNFPIEQVTASHILVPEEEKAKELIAQIEAGGDFAKLAEEHSQDPGSARRGGSLGEFGRGQMVKPFEDAAFALGEGEYTKEPVQSRFGWHIIRVDGKSTQEAPTFDAAQASLREHMSRELLARELTRLRDAATIEQANAPAAPAAPTNEAPAEEPAQQ
ncbi:MAG: peptidylprolyl isomerase [Devosia sp.]